MEVDVELVRNIGVFRELLRGKTLHLPVTNETLAISETWRVGYLGEDGNVSGDLTVSQIIWLLNQNQIGLTI